MSAVEPLHVVHLGSARVRIHWPAWWRSGAPSLDEVASRLPAGCRVSGSSVTGNVLVTFDPRTTGPNDVLVALNELDDRYASGAESPKPLPLLDGEDRAAMARGTIVLGAAVLGLGFALARRAAGDTRRAAESPNLFVTAGLTIAEDLHAVQVGTGRRITGPAPGDLSLKLARVALLASSRSSLGLGLLALTSLRAVTAARAREQRLLEHTRAVGAPPGSGPGAEVEIGEGRGPPIASSVLRGRARTLDRTGTWRAVSRGDVLEGGSIVRGGPLAVRVGPPPVGGEGTRRLPEPRSPAARYEAVAGLASLVAGLGVWAVTRSPRLAVATALAVDPHPALVGSEAAAEGASARLAREGIVCRGGHAWFLRTPDVLVVDGCRPLLDVDAQEPSALGAAGRGLLEICADRSIRVLVATDADGIDTAAGLLAGTGAEVVTDPVLEVVTDQQDSGAIVAVVTDTVDTGEALGTADLAILLGATTPAELLSGVDLVVPDLTRMPQVLSVASRRERAERESVVISAAANVAGASWELLGRPGLRGVSFEVGLASLAALATSWLRLAGSSAQLERVATTALRLSDPHPERWGREPVSDVMATLGTSEHGLTGDEAARRWRPAPEVRDRNPFLAALLEQLRSPLTAALGAGAGLSLLMRSVADVGLIGAVVGANATIGAMEESRVGRAVDALRQMGTSTALVLRDGEKIRIPADEVVPGDVVLVSPGDRVPADARVFRSQGLQVDEAALTGESLPVEKRTDGPTDESRVLLEGSDVTVGHGRAVAFAVGADTRLGATAAALGLEPPPESPLNRRLGAMVREVMPVAVGGALLVAVIGVARRRPLLSQLALGASTAIAAVPEGLPLLARIGQTGVARRLAERNALVRRLAAVEALGRVDVACVDKTGTLTSGRLEVQLVTTFDDEAEPGEALSDDLRDVLRVAAIASPRPDSSAAGAHPTDVAVLDAARAANLIGEVSDRREREAPFDPSTGIHASVLDGRTCLKGAPESIVPRCSRLRARGGEKTLDDSERELLLARSNELAARGLRVLLVAEGPDGTHLADPRDLVALGFVCIADGPRPTAAEAVERCRTAGVRILMLTGDHPLTARAIARQVGIDDDGLVVLGDEIAALSDDELDRRMAGASVVARIAPLEKVRIVQSLQRLGHVVAMTGDGVNDAPALRLADVGVAMGRGGTEVARQAADVVLADDDIATLAEALVEGRTFWGNVRRSLGYLLGGNLGEIGFLVGASLFSPTTPLSARQVLAVNLGSDVLPALSLVAEEPPTHDLSSLAREGTAALARPLRIEILRRGITTAVPTLAAYAAALWSSPAQASTVAYASLVGCQLGHALDTALASGAGGTDATRTIASALGLLGATLVVPPLRSMLGLAPLTATGWALILLASCGAILLDRALRNGLGLGGVTTAARARADEPLVGALA